MRKNTPVLLFGLLCMIGARHLMAQNVRSTSVTRIVIDNDDVSNDNDQPPMHPAPARRGDPREILLRMGERIHTTELDCSHFVQWLFERAGLYYDYAPSQILYDGMAGFDRVFDPEPGDLVVWPGHVGIVLDPVAETFLSALRSGVKTSSYTSDYWKRRGTPRFYRYAPGSDSENEWQPAVAAQR